MPSEHSEVMSGMMNSRKLVLWTLIVLAFVWMAFVNASFYLVKQQRPLREANVLAIGSTLLDLVVAGCMLFVTAFDCRTFG